jgi:hypothetical protein
VEFFLTAPGKPELEMRGFEAATDGPIAHWFLPSGENLLVAPRFGDLDDNAQKLIREAAGRLRAVDPAITPPKESIRLNLLLRPIDSVGTTIETAWPCTVGVAT